MNASDKDTVMAFTQAGKPPLAWVLASLALCMLLPSLASSVANAALPSLATAIAATFAQVQWVVLAYLLATTALVVSVGRLGDIVGRRRLMMAGIVLFSAASLLCGAAPTLWLLIAARAVQGLGAAVMMALAMALVGEAVPKARAGSAMGLLGTMSAVGTALGPTLGGVLIAGMGWRAIFFINVPLGAVALLLAWRCLPADSSAPKTARPRFDHLGTLLLALTLLAYALAMTTVHAAPGRGGLGLVNVALLAAAVLGAGLFVWVQQRTPSPLIHLAVLRDRALCAGLATSALVATVMMATLVVGPFYLSHAFGLDAAHVGLALSAGPLAAALAGVPAGRLVDRFGAARVALFGLVEIASACALLALLPATHGVAGYLAPIVLMTIGFALFQTANNTAVMADVRPEQRGVISGVLTLSRNLGFVTGASAMGAVFALATAAVSTSTAIPSDVGLDLGAASAGAVAAGMRATFAVAALLIVLALAIAVASRVHARRGAVAGIGAPGAARTMPAR